MITYRQAMQEARVAYFRGLLASVGGNVSKAAAASSMNRTHLYKLLHRCGIDPPTFGARFMQAGNDGWRSLRNSNGQSRISRTHS